MLFPCAQRVPPRSGVQLSRLSAGYTASETSSTTNSTNRQMASPPVPSSKHFPVALAVIPHSLLFDLRSRLSFLLRTPITISIPSSIAIDIHLITTTLSTIIHRRKPLLLRRSPLTTPRRLRYTTIPSARSSLGLLRCSGVRTWSGATICGSHLAVQSTVLSFELVFDQTQSFAR